MTFIKASGDHQIGPNHVSLYMTLLQQCCLKGENTIFLKSAEICQLAKLGRTTFHKCMKDLDARGYIKYTPSYSAKVGNMVLLLNFDIT